MQNSLVAVTGASGYVAGNIIRVLLEEGFRVRGTIRSIKQQDKVQSIRDIYPEKSDQIEIVEADLLDPQDKWEWALKGARYVIHIASSFPSKAPKNAQELIKPAVEGTKSVLNASLKVGTQKVIFTSSGTTQMGPESHKKIITEQDWANPNSIPPYPQSKYYAEKYLWEFYEQHKNQIDIGVILPGFITGPGYNVNSFTSGDLVKKILEGDVPGIPNIDFPHADVRYVAKAHVEALKNNSFTGKRCNVMEKSYHFREYVNVLREEFEQQGIKFRTNNIPYIFAKITSIWQSEVQQLLPFWGRRYVFDNTQSKEELGITYRSLKESLIPMAYQLLEKQYIRDKRKKKI